MEGGNRGEKDFDRLGTEGVSRCVQNAGLHRRVKTADDDGGSLRSA